ncbi:MAG: flippase-like domain-containing protein [Bdellovibrionales bacterium]|nr:flippase-like domain-containing protein [Bdellovibrionales bacterium]
MEADIHPHLKTLLKLLIAAVILTAIVRSGHLDLNVLSALFTDPKSAALLLILSAVNLLLLTLRWQFIVVASLKDLKFYRTLKLNLIGNFFNFVFPSSIGGDVVRGYYLAQDMPTQKVPAALSVVLDRVIGLYSLISLSAVTLVYISLNRDIDSLRVLMMSTVFLFLGYSFCLFLIGSGIAVKMVKRITFAPLQKPLEFLLSCHDYIQVALRNPTLFLKTFFTGIFSQLVVSVMFYMVGLFMGESQVDFLDIVSVTPLGFLVMAVPVAPAGIGVGQVAFLFLIKQVTGVSSQFGPTAISAFQVSILFWSLLGGWYYLTIKKPKELEDLEVS